MATAGARYTPRSWAERRGDVIQGLYNLILLDLKGSAAYTHHAMVLGHEDEGIYGFFHEKLNAFYLFNDF